MPAVCLRFLPTTYNYSSRYSWQLIRAKHWDMRRMREERVRNRVGEGSEGGERELSMIGLRSHRARGPPYCGPGRK